MEKWFPIETERLLLREFAAADESDINEYRGDPIVAQYVDWGPLGPGKPNEVLESRLRDQLVWPRDEVTLAAELRSERKVIGGVSLWIIDRAEGALVMDTCSTECIGTTDTLRKPAAQFCTSPSVR